MAAAPDSGVEAAVDAMVAAAEAGGDGGPSGSEDALTGLGLPRSKILTFLQKGVAAMETTATRELLKDPGSGRPGRRLVEIQRAGWDDLGVDQDFGCAMLDRMEQTYPGDMELYTAKQAFMRTAMETYIRALCDRAPSKLERKAKIPRETIIEFFEACNTSMDLPVTREKLAAHVRETGTQPSQIIVETQRAMLETLGFEKEHGCKVLGNLLTDFPQDTELHMYFQQWQQKAQQTCMEAMQQNSQGPHASGVDDAAIAAANIPRSVLLGFLKDGVATMQSSATRELLKDPSSGRPGLRLIEIQKSGWDGLGIDRNVGCAVLDRLEKIYPGDGELFGAKVTFVRTAQQIYIRAIQDRAPSKLKSKGKIPRETLIEFFDACNTYMDLPVIQNKLKTHLKETGQVPNKIIVDAQRAMLETLGVEKEHGCRMLSNIPKDFPNDKELHVRFQQWQQKAQQTCMTVVQEHQARGGAVGVDPALKGELVEKMEKVLNSGEWGKYKDQAKEELDAMTPVARGEIMERLQKKVMVFSKLPPEVQKMHMQKLTDEEKLEMVKGQMLMLSMVKQQLSAVEQDSMAQQGFAPPGRESSQPGGAAALPRGPSAAAAAPAPAQQEMTM